MRLNELTSTMATKEEGKILQMIRSVVNLGSRSRAVSGKFDDRCESNC